MEYRAKSAEGRGGTAPSVRRGEREPGQAELKLAEAKRGLDRLVGAIVAGIITKEEAGERTPALRAAVESAKTVGPAIRKSQPELKRVRQG